MTTFIQTHDGLVNASHIAKIRKMKRREVYERDGSRMVSAHILLESSKFVRSGMSPEAIGMIYFPSDHTCQKYGPLHRCSQAR